MKSLATFLQSAAALTLLSCAGLHDSQRIAVVSVKTGLGLSFRAPSGWEGPGHQTAPSYDIWSFSNDSCYISTRVDSAAPDSRRQQVGWLNDSDTEITQSLRADWQDPSSETIAYLTVAGHRVRVRAAHHVDGEQAWGNLLVGNSVLSFELQTDTREQLERYMRPFLDFLNSVRLERVGNAPQ